MVMLNLWHLWIPLVSHFYAKDICVCKVCGEVYGKGISSQVRAVEEASCS